MEMTGGHATSSAHEAALALARSEIVDLVSDLVEYRGLHDPRQGCSRVEKLLDALNKHLRESKVRSTRAAAAAPPIHMLCSHLSLSHAHALCPLHRPIAAA